MLDAIRKRSGSIVVKLLLGLLVLSFGAWGIGDYIQGGAVNQSVATIGDREISSQEYSTEFQREMNRLQRIFGNNLDAGMARSLGIQQSVLNRMIQAEIFTAAAKDYGMMVTDKTVLQQIQSMESFRGMTGNFDRDMFRQTINNAGYTEDMFVALIRGDLSRSYLLNSFENGAAASDTMLKAIYGYREETRAAEIVQIPDAAFADVAEPTDAEIIAYHQENAAQFMAPAYRALSYIHLAAADLAHEIVVSEEDIVAAYEAREDEFVSVTRRNLEQAIFATEDEANAALGLIASGRSFTDVAAELTGLGADALSLGWINRDELINEQLADAAFTLGVGDISPAIESLLGWHILNVVDAEDETRQTLSEVRDQLKGDIALEKAVDSLFTLANAVDDQMASGATLEDASRALNLPLVRLDGIDAAGFNRAGDAVDELPSGEFLRVAFTTPVGEESPLTESNDDSYFMVRVDSVTESALRPLDTVRDKVLAAILADRRKAGAEAAASAIVDAINGGMSMLDALAQAAIGADTAIIGAPSFKRNGDGDGAPAELPRGLSTILFDQAVGQGGYDRGARGFDGFVVGRVSAVKPADFTTNTEMADTLSTELATGIRSDLMDQLAAALQDTYTVSINQNVLDQLF